MHSGTTSLERRSKNSLICSRVCLCNLGKFLVYPFPFSWHRDARWPNIHMNKEGSLKSFFTEHTLCSTLVFEWHQSQVTRLWLTIGSEYTYKSQHCTLQHFPFSSSILFIHFYSFVYNSVCSSPFFIIFLTTEIPWFIFFPHQFLSHIIAKQ